MRQCFNLKSCFSTKNGNCSVFLKLELWFSLKCFLSVQLSVIQKMILSYFFLACPRPKREMGGGWLRKKSIRWKRPILWKSNAGVNFINVLRAAFTHADTESIKKTDNLIVFFTLLGSAWTTAAHRILMKLTPGVNLANNNEQLFCIKVFLHSFSVIACYVCNFWSKGN